jgi:hypothetical protein
LENISEDMETFYRTSLRNALVDELRRQSKLYRLLVMAEEDHYLLNITGTVVLDDLADALMLAFGRVN